MKTILTVVAVLLMSTQGFAGAKNEIAEALGKALGKKSQEAAITFQKQFMGTRMEVYDAYKAYGKQMDPAKQFVRLFDEGNFQNKSTYKIEIVSELKEHPYGEYLVRDGKYRIRSYFIVSTTSKDPKDIANLVAAVKASGDDVKDTAKGKVITVDVPDRDQHLVVSSLKAFQDKVDEAAAIKIPKTFSHELATAGAN